MKFNIKNIELLKLNKDLEIKKGNVYVDLDLSNISVSNYMLSEVRVKPHIVVDDETIYLPKFEKPNGLCDIFIIQTDNKSLICKIDKSHCRLRFKDEYVLFFTKMEHATKYVDKIILQPLK